MTPDEITILVNTAVAAGLAEHLPAAVQTAVDSAVNGKIKTLTAKMTPMAEAYDKWLSTKRMAGTAIGIFIAFGGLIAATQEFWHLITGYITFR